MDCPQVPILGIDYEKALKLAMALAFPQTPRLTCTRHLRQNFSYIFAKLDCQNMNDKVLLLRFLVPIASLAMVLITWTMLTDFNTWLKA
ncbi:hypothetical protein PoB_001138700 [Plakobranchus ocellatus]|uniref:MULE transposase domain-containing protein n=1 Tax=Plakobranchus ocellatus TaxID=259542 RepID=A0AAV3YQX5_9GAST|nr:hypothetical protein PoB_001138700 [Plakobranchus ocellatus]